MPGVRISAFATDAAGAFLPGAPIETVTDLTGFWDMFVPAGRYRVQVIPPASTDNFTTMDAGSDDTADSDITPYHRPGAPITIWGGFTEPFEAPSDGVISHIDAGVLLVGVIGGTVFADDDLDGTKVGESGISGIEVALLKADGTVARTDLTNDFGKYRFFAVNPGTYRLTVRLPEGQTVTLPNLGIDDTVDSDIDRPTTLSGDLVLDGTNNMLNVDVGLVPIPDGDVSCDGAFSIVDALMIAQYVVTTRSDASCPVDAATQLQAASGDVNLDGLTDIVDALLIAQCEVNLHNVMCPAPPMTTSNPS